MLLPLSSWQAQNLQFKNVLSDLWRDKRGNMKLQTVHAIFKDGTLVFADPRLAPKGVKEVVLTYLDESPTELKAQVSH